MFHRQWCFSHVCTDNNLKACRVSLSASVIMPNESGLVLTDIPLFSVLCFTRENPINSHAVRKMHKASGRLIVLYDLKCPGTCFCCLFKVLSVLSVSLGKVGMCHILPSVLCFSPILISILPPQQDIYDLKDQIQDVEGRYMQGLKELKVEGPVSRACHLFLLYHSLAVCFTYTQASLFLQLFFVEAWALHKTV